MHCSCSYLVCTAKIMWWMFSELVLGGFLESDPKPQNYWYQPKTPQRRKCDASHCTYFQNNWSRYSDLRHISCFEIVFSFLKDSKNDTFGLGRYSYTQYVFNRLLEDQFSFRPCRVCIVTDVIDYMRFYISHVHIYNQTSRK